MAEFDKGRTVRSYKNITHDDGLNDNMKRYKPGREIYVRGSGPLRKSKFSDEENSGTLLNKTDNQQFNETPKNKPYYSKNTPKDKFDTEKVSDDFDKMSVSSNSSHRDRKQNNGSSSSNDSKGKRNKKPEKPIYVPKPVAQFISDRHIKTKNADDYLNESSKRDRGKKLTNDDDDWNDHYDEKPLNSLNSEQDSRNKLNLQRKNKQKHLENRREGQSINGNPTPLMDIKFNSSDIEKLKMTTSQEHFVHKKENSNTSSSENFAQREQKSVPGYTSRQASESRSTSRQASEPRSLPINHIDSRIRDTRSVEPVGVNAKPPPVLYSRRLNKQTNKQYNPPSLEDMPPRFRKKFLKDNGLQDSGIQSSYLGANSEDAWDGSSITFQGSNTNMFYPNVPPPIFNQPPPAPPHLIFTQPPPTIWSQTLPTRSRGRGRLGPHEMEHIQETARFTRSLTPDRFKEIDSRSLDSIPISVENNSLDHDILKTDPNQQYKENCLKSYAGNNQRNLYHNQPNFNNQENTLQKNYFDQPEDIRYSESKTDNYNNQDQRVQKQKEENPHQDSTSNNFKSNQNHILNDNDKEKERNSSNFVLKIEEPSTPEPPKSPREVTSKTSPILNWAEEVEQSEELNKKLILNDKESLTEYNTLPRTTSLNSLQDNTKQNKPRAKRHRHKRRLGKEVNDRSLSREHSSNNNRRGSTDCRQFSRNNSCERNWREASIDSTLDINKPWRSQVTGDSRHSSGDRRNNIDNFHYGDRRYRNGTRSRERSRRNSNASVEGQGYRNFNNERRGSRTSSIERFKDKKPEENWRAEVARLANQEAKESHKPAGIIVLPTPRPTITSSPSTEQGQFHRHLFDPSNPNKPIVVPASGRSAPPPVHDYNQTSDHQFVAPRPPNHQAHNPKMLMDVASAEYEMMYILQAGMVFEYWQRISELRLLLGNIFRALLTTDIKFCEHENMEQYMWKLLYYNIIEYLRKGMAESPASKDKFKKLILEIVDDGMKYLEQTLELLEQVYKFKLKNYYNSVGTPLKSKSYTTLAVMSCQKLLLFLGDLSRYKEQANESNNYGLARQWYIKAHQLNPRNGRPYNQLAVLAVFAKRKVDAVYYYMRSLMASIPVLSSRESLLSLFDENRKKYESTEQKRRVEREAKEKERMKEKEIGNSYGRLRREVWIHPGGGKRVHRTTSTAQSYDSNSEDDELATISSLEVNKRFGMSFLHVHGKLFTKTGMESFQEAAIQMLREFRVMLQHSPIPIDYTRFIQLLALNMFAIDNTQLKNEPLESGYRSTVQEFALIVSLQMFNLIVDRCVQLLKEQHSEPQQNNMLIVSEDVQVLLPAIKIWCDWLLCHSGVWNPPPSCRDFRVGQTGDPWSRLAALVNALEKLNWKQDVLSSTQHEDYELVRLPEDITLGGFLPLMSNAQERVYISKDTDVELSCICLRISKILFFGTVFLCGVDPPVLKLHKNESGESEYISVVEIPSPPVQSDGEMCVESFSSDSAEESEDSGLNEDSCSTSQSCSAGKSEIQGLLHRKMQLEKSQKRQERRQKQVQTILQQNQFSVEMEVKPHYLVADTNCFIDFLPQVQIIAQTTIAQQHLYTLMVPLVVLKELDGLSRGQKISSTRPEYAVKISEAAKTALEFLRSRDNISPPVAIRCVTTKGTIVKSTTFTQEQDDDEGMKNDDRILATCLNLCAKSHTSKMEQTVEGQPRKIYREVVLLTRDRNLRVKAHARDMPVRELPNFMQWAGLDVSLA
uniref:PIN domain-containing protein n=2 Tax=Clastoptera arizonana TaxID=38151 RepID=A0A1B6CG54_9HEMI